MAKHQRPATIHLLLCEGTPKTNPREKDCRKRWLHSLDPSLRKGRWTKEEDRILLDAYSRLGPAWNEIARLIPGRKDDQCSKRHRDILAPLARNRLFDWTPAEDQILRDGVRDLGHRWTSVAARLPGRPPLTCRNRWRNLCKNGSGTAADAEVLQDGIQTAGGSDGVSQTASPTVSPDGGALDAQFNFEDFISAEDYGISSSATNPSPADPLPDAPDVHHAPFLFNQGWNTETPADNDFLNETANLDGLPDIDFAETYHRRPVSSLHHAPSSLPDVPLEPALGTAPGLHAETQRQQPGGGPSAGPEDYRALELASEMSVGTDTRQGSTSQEMNCDAGNSISPMPSGVEGGGPLHAVQSSNQGQLRMTHHHQHSHHHYHHYYHHHHYHHHHH
ncbi:hypothetical protein IMZ48_23445 [Candidatus Bathyarchaeota archaeon]|nr:hypothetical protein [Candidatus Bathyarchaeota archaeon]